MAAKPTISGEKYWDRGLGYVVAMDGSPVSKQAFNSAMEHFSMDPRDHLDVIHVEDLAKEYLPYDMKRASVEEWCSVHGKTLFNKRYQFRTYLKDVKASTKQVVLDALRDVPKADILIVGYVGRKGPKEDPQVLGSVADLSLRESNMSVFIGKRKHIADHTIFVVGVDGSETAHDAVCLAIRLARPTDRIVLIHIEDASAQPVLSGPAGENKSERFDADVVEARYHAFIAARPSSGVCECVFKRILKPVGSAGGVSDTFLDAAQEEDAEIVLVGIDGLGAKAHGHKARVGSNTDNVVKKAPCNIIAVARTNQVFT